MINQEKEVSRKTAEYLEETLNKYIGTKMKDLAAKVKMLKEIRYVFVFKIVLFIIALIIPWKHTFCFQGSFLRKILCWEGNPQNQGLNLRVFFSFFYHAGICVAFQFQL